MKHISSIGFFLAILILICAIQPAGADDASCVRMPCLGKCMSKEDVAGKAFPMFCMQQSACYKDVECTRLDDGKCGWKETPELTACLADKSNNAPTPMPIQK